MSWNTDNSSHVQLVIGKYGKNDSDNMMLYMQIILQPPDLTLIVALTTP